MIFLEGRRIASRCKAGLSVIVVRGYAGRWLYAMAALQALSCEMSRPIRRLVSETANPMLETKVPTAVIGAVNKLRHICGLRPATIIALLSEYTFDWNSADRCCTMTRCVSKD